MENLDRKSAPAAQPLQNRPLPPVRRTNLLNGLPVYLVEYGSIDLIEMSYVVPAGVCFEPQPYVAQLTSSLLTEGTRHLTGLELARHLDGLGAIVEADSGYESASVGLTVLPSRMDAAISILSEIILHPTFPSEELEKLRVRTFEWLEVEEQKTDFVARRTFNKLLLGSDHAYGRVVTREAVEAVKLDDVRAFHRRSYAPVNAFIVAAGRFDQQALLNALNTHFGAASLMDNALKVDVSASKGKLPPAGGKGFFYAEKQGSLQATLRVGQLGFHRAHPDHARMQVVTTILGGYFGSRLMRNIREEKGYTYHIGASWNSLKHGGMLVIQTDLGNEYIQPALREIKAELNLLIEKGVSEDELDLVRNYMMGRMVSGRETPGQIADHIATSLVNEVPLEELDRRFEIIRDITCEDVLRLARKYFTPNDLLEVVCGKMD